MGGGSGRALAERLNCLLTYVHPPGAPYPNAHVAAEISGGAEEYGEIRLTEDCLPMPRNGKRADPSPDVPRTLAKSCAVHVGYPLGGRTPSRAERAEEEVEFRVAMRDQRVRAIAPRSVGPPPEAQDRLTTIIPRLRQRMSLPEQREEESGRD